MMSLRALRPVLRTAVASRSASARVSTPVVAAAVRAFSVTSRRCGSGESDAELSAALSAEHTYETKDVSTDKPQFLKEFEEHQSWAISGGAGEDDVVLTRKFGDETLKLTFQISALDNSPEPLEGEEGEEPMVEPAYITSSLVVTKGDKSSKALCVDLAAQADGFEITNVAIYPKTLADADGPQGDWDRRSKYMGPQFDTLDQQVVDAFGEYLRERGVDDALSSFVVSYCEYKEQKDYVTWLGDVKKFIDA